LNGASDLIYDHASDRAPGGSAAEAQGFARDTVHVSLQVLPRAEGAELYDVVDRAIEAIQASGVPYEVGAMETTMEGDYDRLMAVAKEAQEACMAAGADRVVALIKVDWKRGGLSFDEKVGKYRARVPADR
jgi:uncharacterized protein (TIGR00106 family)